MILITIATSKKCNENHLLRKFMGPTRPQGNARIAANPTRKFTAGRSWGGIFLQRLLNYLIPAQTLYNTPLNIVACFYCCYICIMCNVFAASLS